MTIWLIVVVLQVMLLLLIAWAEGRALKDRERTHITFSRLMWKMFKRWPWTRYLVGMIFMIIIIFNIWGFIHIFFGPCAFGVC